MFEVSTLIAFLIASIAIILAPGPAQALVIARTISGGRKAGIITVLGLNTATIIHALTAALGLSTILATSSEAFSIVKYVGAAYLVYLGIKTLLSKKDAEANIQISHTQTHQIFLRAFITGILNPKVSLFFLAFVPQFIDPYRGAVTMQFLILGSLLGIMDIVYESVLACIVAAMNNRIAHSKRFDAWRKNITGGVLVGLGIRLFLVEKN